MMTLGELGRRAAMLLRRKQFDRELDEEMRLHLELREREQAGKGLSARDAHAAARRNFGNPLRLREASHDSWGWAWLEHLAQDLRYAIRMLRKSPGFTAVAVLTLALGIGANTAIFSIVDAIFLRPLPYPNASKIYLVARTGNAFGGASISPAIFSAWRQRQDNAFEHLSLLKFLLPSTLIASDEPLRVQAIGISTDFLAMAGVQPALGRDFRPEEGKMGGPHVVLISNKLWREQFGADPSEVGKSVTLNGKPYTMVGVLPRGFSDPTFNAPYPDVWFPLQIPAASNNPGNGGLLCFGTLKPGVNKTQAEQALTPALSDLRSKFPKMFRPRERAHLTPLRQMLNKWAGTSVLLLFGAVALVLLIACVNVANLTLARSATRQREMAVRAAIGASRGRIVRQLLAESILLAVISGIVGVAACYASFQFIRTLVPTNLPHVGEFGIDTRVFGFAFALSVITGVIFGLMPALSASRVQLNGSLKESSAQGGAGRSGGMRSALASAEVAISLVLLIAAALALESFARLTAVRPGFDPRNVLTFEFAPTADATDSMGKRATFFQQAIERISALPGVETAALTDAVPSDARGSDILFSMENEFNAQAGAPIHDADIRINSPGYFRALRIPLVRGRTFAETDNSSSAPVVIINQAMARMYWPGQDPIGHRIWIGKAMGPAVAEPAPRQIVGIVSDIRQDSLADAPTPSMYIPYAQTKYGASYFVVRVHNAPLQSVPAIRQTLHELDPSAPVTNTEPLGQVVASSLRDWRFHAILLGIFGALAMLIAAIGVYGVISYSMAQRTHEIGVRMALGAQRRDVMRLVLSQGARLTLVGISVGMLAAFGLTRLMASLLYGVKPTDAVTFASVAILLMSIALLACYIPARRAMGVDPMVALRYE